MDDRCITIFFLRVSLTLARHSNRIRYKIKKNVGSTTSVDHRYVKIRKGGSGIFFFFERVFRPIYRRETFSFIARFICTVHDTSKSVLSDIFEIRALFSSWKFSLTS